MKQFLAAAVLAVASFTAHADAVDTLRAFVRDVASGKALFTQTVTSPDGAKKTSSGSFAFERPNRFRFAYAKPFEQTIVADGEKVWIHDPDLDQVSSRRITDALGATPAAILAGGDIDRSFELSALPSRGGVDWVKAAPRARDGAFQSVQVGFRGKALAAIEIVDAFGQHSLLQFDQWEPNAAIPAGTFRFTPPPGADVIEQ